MMKYSGEALEILRKGVFDVLDSIVDKSLSKDSLLEFYPEVRALALRDLTQSPDYFIYHPPHNIKRHTAYVSGFNPYYTYTIKDANINTAVKHLIRQWFKKQEGRS